MKRILIFFVIVGEFSTIAQILFGGDLNTPRSIDRGGGGAGASAGGDSSIQSIPLVPSNHRFECVDQDAPRKKYNAETCSTSAQCHQGMECKSGKCQCREDYMRVEVDSGLFGCQIAPGFQQPCETDCMKPLRCVAVNGALSLRKGKQCDCMPPAQWNGWTCQIDCSESQVEYEGECLAKVDLGSSCKVTAQCKATFSGCVEGKCQCYLGFVEQSGKCVAENTSSCHVGDPLRKPDGSLFSCKRQRVQLDCAEEFCPISVNSFDQEQQIQQDQRQIGPRQMGASIDRRQRQAEPRDVGMNLVDNGNSKFVDDCPEGSYCQPYDITSEDLGLKGHCCPKPKPTCPLGKPHPTAQCAQYSSDCPWETHYCHAINVDGESMVHACCPKPCTQGKFDYNGVCYRHKRLSQPCTINDECSNHGGECQTGLCACPTGFKDSGFGRCEKACDAKTETLLGDKCYKQVELSETCEKSAQCPKDAYCSTDKKCICRCHTIEFEGRCTYRPRCGFEDFSPAKGSDYIFCRRKGIPAANDKRVAATCPKETVCSSFEFNAGVCCPKPELVCKDGTKVSESAQCNPFNRREHGCGSGKFCERLYFPVDEESSALGGICCPVTGPPTVLGLAGILKP